MCAIIIISKAKENYRRSKKVNKFKMLLVERKVKNKDLAKHLGVNPSLVSQWCTGRCKPTILQISSIAKYTKVTINRIVLCFEEEK